MSKMTQLKLWMRLATADEQAQLATLGDTTRGMLYQVANGHRNFSAEKAILIEAATARMHRVSGGRLPRLYRTDLARACTNCEFAKRCLGESITMRADFPIVVDLEAED